MKICPVCQTSYDDDNLEKCAKDGANLSAAEPLSNPPLPEVVAASPDAITSDFDVEEVKLEQEKQAQAQGINQDDAPVSSAVPLQQRQKKHWVSITVAVILALTVAIGSYLWFRQNQLVNVDLQSVPPGAQVMLDGKKIGTAPISVRILKGTHQVIFEHTGYESIEETLDVTNNGHVIVKKMVPIVAPSP